MKKLIFLIIGIFRVPDFNPSHKKADEGFPAISLIIPTLNAADSLKRTLTKLPFSFHEIIISDGGSLDATITIAENFRAKIIRTQKGRGNQLHQGALAATGDWLLFLHADTELDGNLEECLKNATMNIGNIQKLFHFTFALDDKSRKAQRLEKIVQWRNRKFALPYGDQGFLIHRDFYNEIGGFHPHPLMEDVDFIWRIHKKVGKKAIALLPARATTSAEKFMKDGYLKRSARNLFCLLLFRLGCPTSFIAKLY